MGAAMTQIHLPEDIGDTSTKAGKKPSTESYSFVLASDELISYVGVFSPTSEDEKTNPIYKPASENITDVFALRRQIKSHVLFRNVSRYDFESDQWRYQAGEIGDDSVSDGTISITWSYRINCRASYPNNSEIKFSPNESGIEIKNYQNTDNGVIQQSILFSTRYFTANANPILLTMAVKISPSSSITCVKTWGLYSTSSGYFFRVKSSGLVDNFVVGYRYSLGGSPVDVEIPRSLFNGDKLDGIGSSVHVQTFTNVGMFGIEIGTTGYGARFWVYVTTENSARWVLVHSLRNDSDQSENRITDEEGWPICFENINYGISDSIQTLTKYGVSVTSIGTSIGTTDNNNISGSVTPSLSKSPLPFLGIRVKDFIGNKKNSSSLLPLRLSVFASVGMWRIVLIKNPIKITNPPFVFTPISSLSAVEYSNQSFSILSGTLLGSYLIGTKTINIDLSKLFALNRSFLTTQYTNDVVPAGDFGQQFVSSADELWICIIDANIPNDYAKDIIWETKTRVNMTPTYEDSRSNAYDLDAKIYANLLISEV